jgi:phosphate:Na+ symporter
MIFASRAEKVRQYGALIMGLGLIFFGMGVMSEGMRPLRDYEPFIQLMQNVSNPLVGILIATLFTALIQSSSATMGVVIALALQGLISLEAGIALALGANIGTCATAGLAAIGKPREAVRVAVAHVTFKIAGVALIFAFIPQLAELVRWISPVADADLSGMNRLAAETPRQIANAHTVFNVGIAILFLPLAGLFARFCEWVVPDRPLAEAILIRPKYLDESLLSTPSLALDRARLEVLHMGEHVEAMLAKVMPAIAAKDRAALQELRTMDEFVDALHASTVEYLGKISKTTLSEVQTKEFIKLMEAVNNLENIGDIIETDLVSLAHRRRSHHQRNDPGDTSWYSRDGVEIGDRRRAGGLPGQRDRRTDRHQHEGRDIPANRRCGTARGQTTGGGGTEPHSRLHHRDGYYREAQAHLLFLQAHGQDRNPGHSTGGVRLKQSAPGRP